MEVVDREPSLGRARKRERPNSLAIEDPNPYALLASGASKDSGDGQAGVRSCNRQLTHRARKAHRSQPHREVGDGQLARSDGHHRKGGHHRSSHPLPQQTIDAEDAIMGKSAVKEKRIDEKRKREKKKTDTVKEKNRKMKKMKTNEVKEGR